MPRLTQKGQVTIPVEARRALGLRDGDEIVFEVQGDRAVLRKRQRPGSELRAWMGRLSQGRETDVDEIMKELRGDADHLRG